MRIKPEKVKNILCLRNDRFGEFLLIIPALRALKETFINAKIILVVDSYVAGLAKMLPMVDEVLLYGANKHTLFENLSFLSLLKKKNIDIAVMFNPSKEFNILTYLSAIPVRLGYARKWDFLLTVKTDDQKHLAQMHEVEYNLGLVRLVGAQTKNKELALPVDRASGAGLLRSYGIEAGDNLVCLHPWTSDPIKQWPVNSFKELAARLLEEPDIKVAVIGGQEEASKSLEFCATLGKRGALINLTGKTSLCELALFLSNAKLLISGDSGPAHLAAAVGTKTLVIFRNDIIAKSAKRWGPWGKGHIVIEKESLNDIKAEEVFLKVREALG